LIFQGNLVLSNVSFSLNEISIIGDLELGDNSTIFINSTSTSIFVSGCLNLNKVVFNISAHLRVNQFVLNTTTHCVNITNLYSSDGRCARGTLSGTQLVITLFSCTESTSSTEFDILIGVFIGIIGLTILVAIFLFLYKPARKWLFPYRNRARHLVVPSSSPIGTPITELSVVSESV